jgi:hypothetical protein
VALRASEREGIKLDVASAVLRDLMTETSRTEFGYATYYVGTRQQLTRAGIPDDKLPSGRKEVRFRADGRDAIARAKGALFELEIHWDEYGPGHYSAEHPALSEIARMISITISRFLRKNPVDGERDEINTEELIRWGAEDYRLPPDRRFKLSKNFALDLFAGPQSALWAAIKGAEIFAINPPRQDAPERRRKPSPVARARLVEAAKADTQVQALIASAVDKTTKRKLRSQPPAAAND